LFCEDFPPFFSSAAQTVDNSEPRTMQRAHVGGNQNQQNQPDSVSAQHGLPTAASLAENMQSTRQLVDLAGALLSVSHMFHSGFQIANSMMIVFSTLATFCCC
jgi:hypothetical protein